MPMPEAIERHRFQKARGGPCFSQKHSFDGHFVRRMSANCRVLYLCREAAPQPCSSVICSALRCCAALNALHNAPNTGAFSTAAQCLKSTTHAHFVLRVVHYFQLS